MKEKVTHNRFFPALYRMVNVINSLHIPVYAANACYFLILSVIPILVLLLSLLRFTTLDYTDLILILDGVIPAGLLESVKSLMYGVYESSNLGLVSVSAFGALWAASRGVYGLLTGLNKVYGVREDRSFLYTRFISVIYTFLFLLVLVLTLALHVAGEMVRSFFPPNQHPVALLIQRIIPFRFLFLLLVQTILFCGMFMVFPNRRNRFLASLPGAVAASFGWLVFSNFFSRYLAYAGDMSAIYGSLTSISLVMLWLYFCICILFCGAAINRYLMDIGFRMRLHRGKSG